MNRLLLLLLLFAPAFAEAGVTIHFGGTAKTAESIDAIIAEATATARSRKWRVEPVNKKRGELERTTGDKTTKYVGAIRGVVLYPHDMCEPLRLEFSSDLVCQDFTKTQFAGADIHIAVVELFRRLKPHFARLEIEDEGEYWASSDRERLELHIGTVNRMLKDIRREKPSARGPIKLKDGKIVNVIE